MAAPVPVPIPQAPSTNLASITCHMALAENLMRVATPLSMNDCYLVNARAVEQVRTWVLVWIANKGNVPAAQMPDLVRELLHKLNGWYFEVEPYVRDFKKPDLIFEAGATMDAMRRALVAHLAELLIYQ